MRTLFVAVLVIGCSPSPMHGSTPLEADAAVADSGTFDAGTFDAGPVDAGPPDAGPTFTLHVEGLSLVGPSGPVRFSGAISCCMGGFGWPLYDEAWVDTVAAHDVTFLSMRLGPFLTGPAGESDWATIGGGYVEVSGKADLNRFNETFWARVRTLLEKARARGMYVEVDLADGWSIKHCGNLPGYSAWPAAANVQGEDVCATAGRGAPKPRHEAWIRKVVAVTGGFDNVLYQDGNELGLVQGYDEAWTAGLAALVRSEEQAHGYGRHLFGTQAETAAALALPQVDYGELHGEVAAAGTACGGKPCLVNEYNPRPPLSAAALADEYCRARKNGTYFWYWRHEQDDLAMEATLALIAKGCPGQ